MFSDVSNKSCHTTWKQQQQQQQQQQQKVRRFQKEGDAWQRVAGQGAQSARLCVEQEGTRQLLLECTWTLMLCGVCNKAVTGPAAEAAAAEAAVAEEAGERRQRLCTAGQQACVRAAEGGRRLACVCCVWIPGWWWGGGGEDRWCCLSAQWPWALVLRCQQ